MAQSKKYCCSNYCNNYSSFKTVTSENGYTNKEKNMYGKILDEPFTSVFSGNNGICNSRKKHGFSQK